MHLTLLKITTSKAELRCSGSKVSAGEGGFSYTESLSIPYGVVAYALTAVFGLAIAALQSAWVRSQIKSRLPSEVPRETCENGYW